MKDWIKIALVFAICLGLGIYTLNRLGYFKEKSTELPGADLEYVPLQEDSLNKNPQPNDSTEDYSNLNYEN